MTTITTLEFNAPTTLDFEAPTQADLPNILGRITSAIDRLGQNPLWTPDTHYKVNLILEELATNTINHGAGPSPARTKPNLSITITPTILGAHIHYHDTGTPFNPLTDAPPTPRPNVNDNHLPIGGQGILLIKHMAKSISYRRSSGQNSLEIYVEH